jgi:hypothetical protein
MKSALLAMIVWPPVAVAVAAADMTGTWAIDLAPDFSGHDTTVACTFKQAGRKLTGDCEGSPVAGAVQDRQVRWTVKTGLHHEFTATFSGELDERHQAMAGAWQLEQREGKFKARKQ